MPTGLKRFYGRGHLHFLTFNCHRLLPLLKSARARNLFAHELAKVRGELGFRLIGYVVMQEHVYLLIGEPPVGRPSVVPHRLKLRVAKRRGKRKKRVSADQMALPFGKCRDAPRATWQARFYDFNVCSREEEDGKAELHACESSEARTRERSQRIACEAVGALIMVKTHRLE